MQRKQSEPNPLLTAFYAQIAMFAAISGLFPALAAANIPAFPTAEGYGAQALGGRYGRIIEVTNLNDSGPGTLRAAVTATGPRIVVFRTSGTIELASRLDVRNPFITIAGQTAPGDGICLKNYDLRVNADHVIIRYIRIRPGDNAGVELDAVWVAKGQNVILDHCSASWSVDETLSVSSSEPTLGSVTIQWCIISESLNCSIHAKECHGYGSLIRAGYGNGVTYHHNLYAHHRGRSPRPGNYNSRLDDPTGFYFDFRNNVVYNWHGSYAGYNTDADSITRINFVANAYRQGPNSTDDRAFRQQCPYGQGFFNDNTMDGTAPANPWSLVRFDNFSAAQLASWKQTAPIPMPPVTTQTAAQAYAAVLADAGCSFPTRDAVDARIIDDVINGTGAIIDDEAQVGGWPTLNSAPAPADTDHDGMPDAWETALCLDPQDPADGPLDRDNDGYTNVEEYLNWLPTGQPTPPIRRTDLDCDGAVNLNDLARFAAHYLATLLSPNFEARCDFSGDGRTGPEDLACLHSDWLTRAD